MAGAARHGREDCRGRCLMYQRGARQSDHVSAIVASEKMRIAAESDDFLSDPRRCLGRDGREKGCSWRFGGRRSIDISGTDFGANYLQNRQGFSMRAKDPVTGLKRHLWFDLLKSLLVSVLPRKMCGIFWSMVDPRRGLRARPERKTYKIREGLSAWHSIS